MQFKTKFLSILLCLSFLFSSNLYAQNATAPESSNSTFTTPEPPPASSSSSGSGITTPAKIGMIVSITTAVIALISISVVLYSALTRSPCPLRRVQDQEAKAMRGLAQTWLLRDSRRQIQNQNALGRFLDPLFQIGSDFRLSARFHHQLFFLKRWLVEGLVVRPTPTSTNPRVIDIHVFNMRTLDRWRWVLPFLRGHRVDESTFLTDVTEHINAVKVSTGDLSGFFPIRVSKGATGDLRLEMDQYGLSQDLTYLLDTGDLAILKPYLQTIANIGAHHPGETAPLAGWQLFMSSDYLDESTITSVLVRFNNNPHMGTLINVIPNDARLTAAPLATAVVSMPAAPSAANLRLLASRIRQMPRQMTHAVQDDSDGIAYVPEHESVAAFRAAGVGEPFTTWREAMQHLAAQDRYGPAAVRTDVQGVGRPYASGPCLMPPPGQYPYP